MKKKSFALIEVLIAIVLAVGSCFFLLSFENSLIMKTKKSIQNLEKERLTGQASVLLFEKLYTHQIDWQTVASGGSYDIALAPSGWTAKYTFALKKAPKPSSPDIMYATATLCLQQGNQNMENVIEIPLCLKKEEGI